MNPKYYLISTGFLVLPQEAQVDIRRMEEGILKRVVEGSEIHITQSSILIIGKLWICCNFIPTLQSTFMQVTLSLTTHCRVSKEVVIVPILHKENWGSEKSRNLPHVLMTRRHRHTVQPVLGTQPSFLWKARLPDSGFLAELGILGTLVMQILLVVSLSCLWIPFLPNVNTNTIDTYKKYLTVPTSSASLHMGKWHDKSIPNEAQGA